MLIRSLTKIPLAIAILAIPQLFVGTETANSLFCSSLVQDSLARAAKLKDFGDRGKDGRSGEKGQNGRDSDNLTVFADGSPMTLDLSGANGLQGNNGASGNSAACETTIKDQSKSLQGSNGGHGGDGGDGGNGGNGGALTIYTTNKEDLKQIYVVATGGEGGAPGLGGQGGEGCSCPVPHWNEQTCKGKPGSSNYQCTTIEHKCYDGHDGRIGRDGRPGRTGRLGNLTVINLDRALTEDQPGTTIPLGELKQRGFTLSRNEWASKTGATSLLAPGSLVADNYKELVARHEHSVLLVWEASQPVAEFAKEKVTLRLDENNQPQVNFSDRVWLETSEIKRDRVSEYFVYNAIREKDVTKLKHQGLSGTGSDLTLRLVDRAEKSEILDTDFAIKFKVTRSVDDARFHRVFDYKTKYEGEIPAEAVRQSGNNFAISVGALPIPPEFLLPGTGVEIQIIANRSFADKYSKQQKITVRDIIK